MFRLVPNLSGHYDLQLLFPPASPTQYGPLRTAGPPWFSLRMVDLVRRSDERFACSIRTHTGRHKWPACTLLLPLESCACKSAQQFAGFLGVWAYSVVMPPAESKRPPHCLVVSLL